MAGVPDLNPAPMTVEEFFAFTDRRPDHEKWELIEGEPILNASPRRLHQVILGNLIALLGILARSKVQPWEAIPGIGVRVSDTSLPEPDVLTRPKEAPHGDPLSRECDDIIVAFEILSPSTADRDLGWKRTAYATLPPLTHYVVIAQDVVEVVVYDRDLGFDERRLDRIEASLDLPSLGISLPLMEIYRGTGLGHG
jgi:Uma2 family endonuclease